jgi:hypothetical protein
MLFIFIFTRIFPVHVQPVEAVGEEEAQGGADEGGPLRGGFGHIGELGGSLGPSANSQKSLQIGVICPQTCESITAQKTKYFFISFTF